MKTLLCFILSLLGLVCFIAAAFDVVIRRINLIALGLAFVAAVMVITYGHSL